MSISIEEKLVACIFGDNSHAVGRYECPDGISCFPDEKIVDLCGQHVIKSLPLGESGMNLVLIYDTSFYEMYAPEALE